MKTLVAISLAVFLVTFNAHSEAINPSSPPLQPGSYVLIPQGETAPDPILIDLQADKTGALSATLGGKSKGEASITKDGASYVLQIKRLSMWTPPEDNVDGPKTYYLTFVGQTTISDDGIVLRGVYTSAYSMFHDTSSPGAVSGSFILFSTDKKP